MTNQSHAPGTMKSAIQKLIHSMPNSPERSLLEINLIWQQVVGLGIASRSAVSHIGKEHLSIQTDSVELMNALLGAHNYLLQRLRNLTVHARTIRTLQFKVNAGFTFSSQARPAEILPSDAPSDSDPVIQILNALDDPELKEVITRAYTAYPKDRRETQGKPDVE